MRFSARQQYCLETMGIVPWVSRHVFEVAPDAEVVEAADVAGKPPEAVAELGQWVSSRALVPIHFRGSEFQYWERQRPLCWSSSSRQVLNLLQQHWKGDSARLFALMLRSIQLTARNTRQCIVSTEPVTNPDISIAGVACTPQTRAVLLLMNPWPFDMTDIDVGRHSGRLQVRPQGLELPLWRIAHPQLLLEQPLLKRQSWQVLKSLQSVLSRSSSL